MRILTIMLMALILITNLTFSEAIEIISPAQGIHVAPGENITVIVAPSDGQSINSIKALLSTTEEVMGIAEANSGNFKISFRIPYDAICSEFVSIIADAAGKGPMFRVLELYSDPGAPTSLTLIAPSVMTIKGKISEATLRGIFPDGTSRDISDPDCGTVFSTNNQNIIVSRNDGLLQPVNNGTATFNVSSWGLQSSKDITVNLSLDTIENQLPVPVVSDLVTTRETSVYLDATLSSDPDGDPVSYEWRQTGGRIVFLEDSNTSKPFFLTPFVEQETVLTFSLIVTDSKLASSMPKEVKVTVQPVSPVPQPAQ